MSASSISSTRALKLIFSTSRPKIMKSIPAPSSSNYICQACRCTSSSSSSSSSSTSTSTFAQSCSSSSSSSSSRPRRRDLSNSNLNSKSNPIPNSVRGFSTSKSRQSSWPVGASSEESQPSATCTSIPKPHSTNSNATFSRAKAGPALEDSPPPPNTKIQAFQGSRSGQDQSHLKNNTSASASALPPPPRQKTIMYLNKMKQQRTPIAMLTAFDYPTSLSIRSADIDICLIGDSLANVCLGYSTTQSLTLEAMIHHCQSVQRGLSSPLFSIQSSQSNGPNTAKPLVIADLPFGQFITLEDGIKASVKLIQQGGVDGLKIEGGKEILPLIRTLTGFGIPVMAHLGLQPQKVASTSGYRVQAKSAKSALELIRDSKAAQEAGAFALLLECIPSKIAKLISQDLHIPTIGIGAGNSTDGQVLVISDMLGELTSPAHVLAGLQAPDPDPDPEHGEASSESSSDHNASSPLNHENRNQLLPRPSDDSPLPPKFVRSFVKSSGTSLGALRIQAVRDYVEAVRERSFPNEQESYKMERKEWDHLIQLLQTEKAKAKGKEEEEEEE